MRIIGICAVAALCLFAPEAGYAQAADTAAPAARPAPPPLETFRRVPALSDVIISDDGEKIAYLTYSAGRRRLVVQDLAGTLIRAVDMGELKIRGIRFAGPGHVLVFTSTTTVIAGVMMNRSELWQVQSLSLATGKSNYLMRDNVRRRDGKGGMTTNVIWGDVTVIERDGKWSALAPSYSFGDNAMHLYRIDLDSGIGAIEEEGAPDSLSWRSDRNGYVYARIEYDDDSARWRLLARKPGARWNELLNVEAPIDTPTALGLGRDGQSVVVYMRQGDAPANLHEVSIETGEVGPALLKEPAFFDYAVFHPATNRLAALVHRKHGLTYEWFDAEMERGWRAASGPFRKGIVAEVDSSLDMKRRVLRYEGPKDTGAYYLVDLAAKTAGVIGEQRPGFPEAFVPETRVFEYAAADGFKVPAYLTLPPGREARNLPLIVMPHGGPASRDYPGYDDWTYALASRGYAVLRPQFRGSEGFGEEHLSAGMGEWGKKMQTDLSDGVRHLAAEGAIDPKRVCIFGWSYGGYAAMAGVTLERGVYRCAVAGAGVSDLERMMQWEANAGGERDSQTTRYWNRFMGPRSDWAALSPARLADRADAPVLLIHGRDDTVVPFQQSAIFRDSLQKAGKPVELVELKSEDHWLSRDDTSADMLKSLVGFLEKHNPPY